VARQTNEELRRYAMNPELLDPSELPDHNLSNEDKQIGSSLDELEARGLFFQTAGEA